jgi:phosphatidylglycerol:prolipoprotein diacylglycerol transferase
MIWNMNPVAFELGIFSVRWYGLVYVAGFLLVDWLAPKISAILVNVSGSTESARTNITKKIWSDITFGAFLCGVLGGRLGEFVFYNPSVFLSDPLEVLKIWHGGMSIHGGIIGAVLFLFFFARSQRLSLWHITDSVVVPVAFVLGLGRIINYVNGELVGIPTNSDWGVVFPHVDTLLRHPTQLYESATMFGLGVLLLGVFLRISNKRKAGQSKLFFESGMFQTGWLSGLFLVGYGVFRFVVECWKDSPDVLLGLTMGQVLCVVMIGLGGVVLVNNRRLVSK